MIWQGNIQDWRPVVLKAGTVVLEDGLHVPIESKNRSQFVWCEQTSHRIKGLLQDQIL